MKSVDKLVNSHSLFAMFYTLIVKRIYMSSTFGKEKGRGATIVTHVS